jgi:hypothetical protein
MSPRHELAAVAHSMLLELVPSGHKLPLPTLVRLLDGRVRAQRVHDASFDFAYWARGTIAEVVAYLVGCDLLTIEGMQSDDLHAVDAWPSATLQRTARGDAFLRQTRRLLVDLLPELRNDAGAVQATA